MKQQPLFFKKLYCITQMVSFHDVFSQHFSCYKLICHKGAERNLSRHFILCFMLISKFPNGWLEKCLKHNCFMAALLLISLLKLLKVETKASRGFYSVVYSLTTENSDKTPHFINSWSTSGVAIMR